MLKDLIEQALIEHGFCHVYQTKSSGYYVFEQGESVRFAVLHYLDILPSPAELNTEITKNAPSYFLEHPAFKKNCDLVCILKVDNLSDFKVNEKSIFAIEEDPYQYKKYVLYYSKAEETLLNNVGYKDLKDTISDKDKFNNYKIDPLKSSIYSIAAKVFIKLPFLELGYSMKELVPLKLQADEAASELGLLSLYDMIKTSSLQDFDIDKLTKGLIKNELENI